MHHQPLVADPPERTAGSVRIDGIEALRGIAAVAVVLCHTAHHIDATFGAPLLRRLFEPGHSGVDLFFVLSGFIILLVHHRDIERPQRLGRYAWRRFARVWPLYWVALLTTVAKRSLGGEAFPDPGMLAWNMTLLPIGGEPLLGIAWTLKYEALFYLLFGLLLIDRRWGVAVFGGWLAVVLWTVAAGSAPNAVTGAFAVEFFFGMAAAALVRWGTIGRPAVLSGMGAALFAAAWIAESTQLLDGYGVAARLAYGLPAAMLVAGVAAGRPTVPRPLVTLGSASYAVYLFHLLGIGAVWQVLSRMSMALPAAAWFGMLALGGVAGGLVAHRLVERPLLARLRR